jgi:hypothetical protein
MNEMGCFEFWPFYVDSDVARVDAVDVMATCPAWVVCSFLEFVVGPLVSFLFAVLC